MKYISVSQNQRFGIIRDMKALIIEDDQLVANKVKVGLQDIGFDADIVDTGKEGLDRLVVGKYNLAIVDIKLKDGKSGLDVVKEAKQFGNNTPTIFLSAMDDPTIKSLGLDLGADDYLSKPFQMSELISRIRAILRRTGPSLAPDKPITYEDVTINLPDQVAFRNGRDLKLRKMELKLLTFLIINAGRRYTQEYILERVWNYDAPMDSNIVEVTVRQLRKKLNGPGERELISNVRNQGYAII